jgi:hypothetical protein
MFIRECSLNPNSSVLYSKLLGRSMTAKSPIIAQQYSPATFVKLCFHSRKEKFDTLFKNIIISVFLLLFQVS